MRAQSASRPSPVTALKPMGERPVSRLKAASGWLPLRERQLVELRRDEDALERRRALALLRDELGELPVVLLEPAADVDEQHDGAQRRAPLQVPLDIAPHFAFSALDSFA